MDPTSGAGGAVATAVNSFSANSGLSVVALKSAEKEQTSILQLFNNASSPAPSPETGRGQNLNITA